MLALPLNTGRMIQSVARDELHCDILAAWRLELIFCSHLLMIIYGRNIHFDSTQTNFVVHLVRLI